MSCLFFRRSITPSSVFFCCSEGETLCAFFSRLRLRHRSCRRRTSGAHSKGDQTRCRESASRPPQDSARSLRRERTRVRRLHDYRYGDNRHTRLNRENNASSGHRWRCRMQSQVQRWTSPTRMPWCSNRTTTGGVHRRRNHRCSLGALSGSESALIRTLSARNYNAMGKRVAIAPALALSRWTTFNTRAVAHAATRVAASARRRYASRTSAAGRAACIPG